MLPLQFGCVLFAAVFFAINTDGCGESAMENLPLLAEDRVTKPNDMPWHVAIYRKKNPTTGKEHQYICGGTIMSPTLIISAAHCFYNSTTNKPLPAEEYEIVVAKYTRDYNKMDDPLTKVFNVAGWGLTENGKLSDVLLVSVLPFISEDKCLSMVSKHFRKYVSHPYKFCSGVATGAGTRQGNAGGGWIYKKDGHYFIYGILSFKEPSNSSLAVFTRIPSHLDWIKKIQEQVLHRRGL